MFIKFLFLTFLSMLIFPSCGGEKHLQETPADAQFYQAVYAPDLNSHLRSLDELAALERAGHWIQGMALSESGIRENAGDYAGAVAAAFKEMSFAYGRGLMSMSDIENGLLSVLSVRNDDVIIAAVNATLAFISGSWDEALAILQLFFDDLEEPDGFGRWMKLVCALEKNREDRLAGEAYKSIRARYVPFPEYWYRGARAFPGVIGAEYAENCINLSPLGPFSNECRRILAVFSGLKPEDSLSIKTKTEIEAVISRSLNAGNPDILDSLLPLISLPDNPYTVFAVGALRSLNSVPDYRNYFIVQAALSSGRLAERLLYISRG